MSLADLARMAATASLPLDIAGCACLGTWTITVLTALFGPDKFSKRAREVLRLFRRDSGGT